MSTRVFVRHLASWLVAVAATAIALVPTIACAQCPSDSLVMASGAVLLTADPTFRDSLSESSGWATGDHREGVFTTYNPGMLSPTAVFLRDRYDVTGVPVGTVVSLTAMVVVQGTVYTSGCAGSGCCGTCTGTLRSGADTFQGSGSGATFTGSASFSFPLMIPFTIVAGTPRDLELELSSRRCPGGSHTVTAVATLGFGNVGDGMQVTSCKGYGGTGPTPARPTTWGRLKTIYR
jgi:hypothetical protein